MTRKNENKCLKLDLTVAYARSLRPEHNSRLTNKLEIITLPTKYDTPTFICEKPRSAELRLSKNKISHANQYVSYE